MYLYDLVRLFPPNDKSKLSLIYKKEEVFCDRVDYLQFNVDGRLNPLCNKAVAFWYIDNHPIDPNKAERTSDNKYIIVPNVMTVVLAESPVVAGSKYGFFNDIPGNGIKIKDMMINAAWLSPTYVEFIGEYDETGTDIVKTNDMYHAITMNSKPQIFDAEYHSPMNLPDDFYSRKIINLDLSCLYIDPEIYEPDVTGKYTEPKPRLSITIEGSLYNGN